MSTPCHGSYPGLVDCPPLSSSAESFMFHIPVPSCLPRDNPAPRLVVPSLLICGPSGAANICFVSSSYWFCIPAVIHRLALFSTDLIFFLWGSAVNLDALIGGFPSETPLLTLRGIERNSIVIMILYSVFITLSVTRVKVKFVH